VPESSVRDELWIGSLAENQRPVHPHDRANARGRAHTHCTARCSTQTAQQEMTEGADIFDNLPSTEPDLFGSSPVRRQQEPSLPSVQEVLRTCPACAPSPFAGPNPDKEIARAAQHCVNNSRGSCYLKVSHLLEFAWTGVSSLP